MTKQTVSFERRGTELVARVECELDHHTAREVREAIDRELFRICPSGLIIDLSGVGFMDSSGIALIIGRCECASSLGAAVVVRGLSAGLLRLVRLCGIEKIGNLTVVG